MIDLANRAVADYGFRQAVLYGPNDIGNRTGLSPKEQETLEGPVMEFLVSLSIPVQPEDIPSEQARVVRIIRTATDG